MTNRVGSWVIPESPAVTAEVRKIFTTANHGIVGVKAEPFALLETQVVKGTNYKILAKVTMMVPDAETKLAVYSIYQPLGDEPAEVIGVDDLML